MEETVVCGLQTGLLLVCVVVCTRLVAGACNEHRFAVILCVGRDCEGRDCVGREWYIVGLCDS